MLVAVRCEMRMRPIYRKDDYVVDKRLILEIASLPNTISSFQFAGYTEAKYINRLDVIAHILVIQEQGQDAVEIRPTS
jgi:hypothetical protein